MCWAIFQMHQKVAAHVIDTGCPINKIGFFACHFFTHNTWKGTTPWTRKGKSRTSSVTSNYVVWLKASNHDMFMIWFTKKIYIYFYLFIYEVLIPTSMVHHMTALSNMYLLKWHHFPTHFCCWKPSESTFVRHATKMGCRRDALDNPCVPIPSMYIYIWYIYLH